MSRLSFALTIAVLVCAVVVLSAFALQKLFISGPGNQGSEEATQETTQVPQTTEETTAYGEKTIAYYKGGTTVLKEEDVLEAPPDSTLSHGGREVKSSPLDVMCWVTWGPRGACLVDSGGGAPGEPPPKKKLYVPSGSEMLFRYEAPRPPDKVAAHARPLLGLTPYGSAKVGSHEYRLAFHGSGVERTITVVLPPREYLVYVSVDDPQGSISYTFRIMVQ